MLLMSLPVIDVLLLAFTALDLRAGSAATVAHGLATVYVGFTVAWIIAISLLSALMAHVGDDVRTEPLHLWFRIAFGSVFLWFVFGPGWSLLFFRRKTLRGDSRKLAHTSS